jgi:thiol-disulfide isomerase/thioredoxin
LDEDMTDTRPRLKFTALTAGLLAAAALAIGVLYGVSAHKSKPAPVAYQAYATGAMAKLNVMRRAPPQPATTLLAPDGRQTTLAAFKGRVVLVNFWALWCAPCLEEMPTLAALQAKEGGADFEVIAVNVDMREPFKSEARAELEKLSGGALRFFQDPTMAITYDAKVQGMPTTILYDRHGRELARLPGAADWASPQARAMVRAAIAQGVKP